MIYKSIYTVGLEQVGLDCCMTNKAIMAVMEDIAGAHSASLGCGLADVEKSGVVWVLLDWNIKIINRPKYREQITACTWSRKYNTACAYRDFELLNDKGEVMAAGSSRWVLIDLQNRRPQRLTEERLAIYQSEPERNALDEEMKNIAYPKGFFDGEDIYKRKYEVLRRDIDTNLHMHNLSYLEAAYETLPEDIYRKGECSNIRICYKKEIMYGEEIVGKYLHTDGKEVVCFQDTEGGIRAVVELW